jgi:CCR4-NOT transcription complex subunit 7/8
MQSGMVLSDHFHWICFHGCYDFAYLIKVLTGAELPNSLAELLELLDLFFPRRGDVKLLAKPLGNFGSLLSIAEQRGLQCTGVHQGGLDALLTRDVFFSFPDVVQSAAWSGDVFGLEEDVDTSEPQEWETPPQEWPQRTRYLEAPRTPPEQQQQQYGLGLTASPNPHSYSPPQQQQQQYNNHHNQYRDNGYYGYNQRNNYNNQYVQQDNYAYNRGYTHHNWQQRDDQYRRPNVPAY